MKLSHACALMLIGFTAACGSSDDDPTAAATTGSGGSGPTGGMGGSGGMAGAGGSAGEGGVGGAGGSGAAGGAGGAGGSASFSDVAFTAVAFELPEWVGVQRELVLLQDPTAFTNYFGVPAPAAIDWATEDALFYTEGALPFPGHIASLQSLAVRDDNGELQIGSQLRAPGNACEVLEWQPPAYQLVKFAAIAAMPQVTEANTATDFDCAANGAAVNTSCDPVNLCGANLICGNLTRYSPGTCYPISHHGVFSDRMGGAIPDGSASGLVRTLSTSGLSTVDTDVIVKVTLNHPDWSQLTITLTNPDSNEVPVWTQEAVPAGAMAIHRVPVGFSGDESVNGTWSLKVVDNTSGQVGTLSSWDLEIVSRLD